MKSWLIWTLLLAIVCYIQGNVEILRKVNVQSDDAYRMETFSVKNKNSDEEELVIEGTHSQSIYPKDNTDFIYRVETIYVADKDGYRVKYKLIREPYAPILHLNPSSLKSLAG